MKLALVCVLYITVFDSDLSTDAEHLFQQSLVKNQQGMLIEASVLLTEAISLDDQQAKYFHQRGLNFLGMNEINHGIKDFNTAVDLKTDQLSVYLKLIDHHMENSQFMTVIVITDQLLENLPDQAVGAYHDKGRAYEAMLKPVLAIQAYQAAIAELSLEQVDFKILLLEKITAVKQQEMMP